MRLTDCFMELIAYTAYFLKTVQHKQPSYDQVKADIFRALSQSEDCVKKDLFPREDFDLARFAVCAWVDEAILNSNWNFKDFRMRARSSSTSSTPSDFIKEMSGRSTFFVWRLASWVVIVMREMNTFWGR
jgi:hypothetical protein